METTFRYRVPPERRICDEHDEELEIQLPVFLPSNANIGDYARKLCSTKAGKFLDYDDVHDQMQKFSNDEASKERLKELDDAVTKIDAKKLFDRCKAPQKIVKQPTFAEKFTFIASNCSSESLIALMQMELCMKREMTEMIRARNWEVEQLSKQCEKVLTENQEHDMHPHKLSHLNEKLRQVYTTYSLQVAQLSETQKKRYRLAVDSLYTKGSIPATLLEDIDLDENYMTAPLTENQQDGQFQESFTMYIGAQLKSMHNACLVTANTLTDLCQTLEHDWTISSRLEMATKLYGRSLTGITLLVPRDPMHHVNSSSQFFRICEQSTELHFAPLAEQLKQVVTETRRGNCWRASCLEKTTELESNDRTPKITPAALRADQTLGIGNVYMTRHSNLHKIQIVFHLVVDEMLQNCEISSRHPCLNGIRNIIKMTAHFGITSIHLPLLLIDKPDESTTIAWCVKRAEMVYKCVKGYLMEVCSGNNLDSLPHYNVHFVMPSGLAETIYSTISNMFPTVFHLVPSVSISTD